MVKKKMKSISVLLITVLVCLFVFPVLAEENTSETRVFDDAKLLLPEEIIELETYIQEVKTYTEMDLAVATSADLKGVDMIEYADDFYISKGFGMGHEKSGALILIDMENREFYIYTYGYMIDYLNDNCIETIVENVTGDFSNGNYYNGLLYMMDEIASYYDEGIPENAARYNAETGETTSYKSISLMEILLPLLICFIIFIIMYKSIVGSYQMKIMSDTYLFRENSKLDLDVKEDKFVRKVVTSHRIQNTNGSSDSGISTTHSSSGGGSHGGGGGSF